MKSQRFLFYFLFIFYFYYKKQDCVASGIQEMLVVKHPLSILQNLRYARHIELDCELPYYLLSLYESNVIL